MKSTLNWQYFLWSWFEGALLLNLGFSNLELRSDTVERLPQNSKKLTGVKLHKLLGVVHVNLFRVFSSPKLGFSNMVGRAVTVAREQKISRD